MTSEGPTSRKGRHTITVNAVALILAKLISPALSLALMVVLAKAFGSDLVGRYYLPLTWLFIFQTFAALGVGDVVAREVSRIPERAGRYLANGLLLGLVSSTLASFTMVGLAWLFHYPREIELSIRLLSLSLAPSAVLLVVEGLYLARGGTRYIVLVSFFETLVSVGLNLFLLWRGHGLLALMGVIVATRTFSAGIHLSIIHRKIARLKIELDRQLLRTMLSPTIVFGLGKVLGLIVLKADVIILSKLRGIGEVGLYMAAGKLMEVWLILPHAFGFAAFPLLAREFCRSQEATRDILIHTSRRLFSIVVPVVVGTILFSPEIVSFLYGKAFAGAIPIVQLLMFTFLLMCGDVLLGNICRAVGHQNFDLIILSVNATVNVALNFLLIPHYGLMGACYATLISMILSLVSRWYYVRSRIFELDWMGAILKPFALVVLPVLSVMSLRKEIDSLLLGGAFLGVYSLGLWLTKSNLARQL